MKERATESECSERAGGFCDAILMKLKWRNRKKEKKKAESRKEVEMVPAGEGPHSDEILSIQNRRERMLIMKVMAHVSLRTHAEYGYKGSAWSLSVLETL